MDLLGTAGMAARLDVAAAQRLPELLVGQLYRVQVTQWLGEKVEILLGNQYLLAATPFRFQVGDTLTLKLVSRTADMLTFQVALPPAGTAQQGQDLATLLRAAGLADTTGHRAALTALLKAGIAATPPAVSQLEQLGRNLPPEAVAAFLPLYKELLDKEIKLSQGVLHELARLSLKAPATASLLSAALAELEERRVQQGRRRRMLDDAVAAALTTVNQEKDLPTAEALKQQLQLLYASPEKALADALARTSPDQASAEEVSEAVVELADLANLALGEEVPAALVELINVLQAQRVKSRIDKAGLSLSLPLELNGEPTEANLSLAVLGQQYYQNDYSLRLRVANQTQGVVEIHLKTRGPGLVIDVAVEEPEVLPYYELELPRLSAEIAELGTFIVRRAGVSRQNL